MFVLLGILGIFAIVFEEIVCSIMFDMGASEFSLLLVPIGVVELAVFLGRLIWIPSTITV